MLEKVTLLSTDSVPESPACQLRCPERSGAVKHNQTEAVMAQGGFKKNGGAMKVKGKGGKGKAVAAKSSRRVNKGKTAVKKGCECAILPSLVCRVTFDCCCAEQEWSTDSSSARQKSCA